MLREPDTTVTWMRRIALVAVLLAFGVVVLGRVRAADDRRSGLPRLAGAAMDISRPRGAPNEGRAWREMIHRYFAGSLVVLTLILAVLAFLQKRPRAPGNANVPFALAVVATIIVQALLGMLTVTWQVATADRDPAPAVRHDDARAAVVAVA